MAEAYVGKLNTHALMWGWPLLSAAEQRIHIAAAKAAWAAAPSPEPQPSEEEGERRDERPSPDTSALLAEAEEIAGELDAIGFEATGRCIRRLSQALREARG